MFSMFNNIKFMVGFVVILALVSFYGYNSYYIKKLEIKVKEEKINNAIVSSSLEKEKEERNYENIIHKEKEKPIRDINTSIGKHTIEL